MNELSRVAPALVAFWGWALLVVAASPNAWGVLAGAVGFVAAILARRSFVGTALVELVALAVVALLAPPAHVGFLFLGAALAVAARALDRALDRRA